MIEPGYCTRKLSVCARDVRFTDTASRQPLRYQKLANFLAGAEIERDHAVASAAA